MDPESGSGGIDRKTEVSADVWKENIPLTCCEEGGESVVRRRPDAAGDAEGETRLNPNVHNVFFMRAESMVWLEWAAQRRKLSGKKRGGMEREAQWIIDSGQLIEGSSRNWMWEEDKVEGGRPGEGKSKRPRCT